MPPLPTAKDMARSEIALMADLFKQTRDPACAWRAFSLARQHSLELPAIIDTEVDRFAAAVGALATPNSWTKSPGDKRKAAPPEAIGRIFKGHKGRNAGTGSATAYRAYALAVFVEKLIREGDKSFKAVERVRIARGVSKTTVENAMAAHAELGAMDDTEFYSACTAVAPLLMDIEEETKLKKEISQRSTPSLKGRQNGKSSGIS